jgi:hypothetical protein
MSQPSISSARHTNRLRGEAGIALFELMIAGAVLAIAACGLSVVLVNSLSTSARNRETAQARMAAWQLMEQLQNIPVGDVYSTFNMASNDDPLGENTAPGGVFMIETKPAAIQVSNMTGEILFPESDPGVLREDVHDPDLGMPRDLNGDGMIDSENHARDYVVLPVRVRVRWRGVAGESTFEVCSLLLNE